MIQENISKKQSEIVPQEQASSTPIIPLKNIVLMPKSITPVIIGRESSIKAIEHALLNQQDLFICLQKKASDESISTTNQIYKVGTCASIAQAVKGPQGKYKVLLEGKYRAKIESINQVVTGEALFGNIKKIDLMYDISTKEATALWSILKKEYNFLISTTKPKHSLELPKNITIEDTETVLDTLIIQLNLPLEDQQAFIQIASLKRRFELIIQRIKEFNEISLTEEKIQKEVQKQVENNQREYYLHEQLKAIQKELKNDTQAQQIDEYKKHLKKSLMPEATKEKVSKEITRLEGMQQFSAEASICRTYIECLLDLPWKRKKADTISIKKAEAILNSKHYGLEKVKKRINEILATYKFNPHYKRSSVICLAGPPGVGKTSFGKSIAQALGREFVRIALGGIKDESEIRGHRKTYIGAMPGKIIQAMKKVKSTNPVILLDEIDKISSDIHGDPAAALLEVLDPEQNSEFSDHYLETTYNLSNVIFITTANQIENIPHALYDRMEIISLSGYTEQEKAHIANKFLIPKHTLEHGLTTKNCKFEESAIETLIKDYTKEAGVRQLERFIIRIIQHIVKTMLEKEYKRIPKQIITKELICSYLKTAPFKQTKQNLEPKVGIATGLAWTELGGDTLDIEVALLPGKGNVTLTGQLGDVMQESAQAALSYLRLQAKKLKIKKTAFTQNDIHLHIPEGATPKDGPSAGITMCTALASAFTGKPVDGKVAMTGEISLQGRALPVGGLKEKFLAAHTHGCTKVLAPEAQKDVVEEALEDIKNDINLKVVLVKTMDDVLKHALVK